MDKKTALVTGGTSGIGQAVAIEYARNGWDCILWYNSNIEGAKEVQACVRDLGVQCFLVSVDFTQAVEVESAIQDVASETIDSLVNNAGGYSSLIRFSELNYQALMSSMAVNFSAAFLLSAAVFDSMMGNGFGRIVNISSIAAKYGGSAYSMQYGCAKRALEGVTRTLSREGASKGVLVNTVRPGVIDTEFHRRLEKDMASRVEMIPMKRMGTCDEVAKVVYSLGSHDNTYITGQTVTVSGGE